MLRIFVPLATYPTSSLKRVVKSQIFPGFEINKSVFITVKTALSMGIFVNPPTESGWPVSQKSLILGGILFTRISIIKQLRPRFGVDKMKKNVEKTWAKYYYEGLDISLSQISLYGDACRYYFTRFKLKKYGLKKNLHTIFFRKKSIHFLKKCVQCLVK